MSSQPTQASVPQATQIQRRFRFGLALPLGQLVVCALILLPARGYIFYELGLTRLPAAASPLSFGPFGKWSRQNGMGTVAAINLPAGLVIGLPYAIFSQDHSDLKPANVDLRVWRALLWPIAGTVFWWIAGRGADALVAARRRFLFPRLRWLETAVGGLIFAGAIFFVIGIEFFSGKDRADLQGLAAASGLWTILGGLTVAGRIAQWRIRRTQRKLDADPMKAAVTSPSQPQ